MEREEGELSGEEGADEEGGEEKAATDKERRDRDRRPKEPYEVPTAGAFWMHDDRQGDEDEEPCGPRARDRVW